MDAFLTLKLSVYILKGFFLKLCNKNLYILLEGIESCQILVYFYFMPTCRKARDLYFSSIMSLFSKPLICLTLLLFCQNYASHTHSSHMNRMIHLAFVQCDICILHDITDSFETLQPGSNLQMEIDSLWIKEWYHFVYIVHLCQHLEIFLITVCWVRRSCVADNGSTLVECRHAAKLSEMYRKCSMTKRGHTKCQQLQG